MTPSTFRFPLLNGLVLSILVIVRIVDQQRDTGLFSSGFHAVQDHGIYFIPIWKMEKPIV